MPRTVAAIETHPESHDLCRHGGRIDEFEIRRIKNTSVNWSPARGLAPAAPQRTQAIIGLQSV
jgi:hypothetical protein